MPWNECKPMDERLRFVARLLEGEQMAPLCREFGISRVTGYKMDIPTVERYLSLPCPRFGVRFPEEAPGGSLLTFAADLDLPSTASFSNRCHALLRHCDQRVTD
jgi:hypothetical protein